MQSVQNEDWIQTLAIGHADEFRPAVKRHARISKILRDYIPRPAVFRAVKLHGNPAAILVGGIAEVIGFAVNMLDAGIGDTA